ncbi:hypothetical protein L484_022761 [Morus notabilis]|uniref:Uncharacterized protein n=1 Tax=Morus notabilis TaxID=981085 RepID=W9T0H4_9ROSA|nr:hypothetical protein L484_022761 [Morus notabilis]
MAMISGNVAVLNKLHVASFDDREVERSYSPVSSRATVTSRYVLSLSWSQVSLSRSLSLLQRFVAVDLCKIASNSDRGPVTN